MPTASLALIKTLAVIAAAIPIGFGLLIVLEQIRLTYTNKTPACMRLLNRSSSAGPTMAEDWNTYFRRIRLGRWTDNSAVCWMPFHGFHIFIGGETGYGKTNTQRVILSELSYGIGEGAIEVIGLDAQLGVELQPVADAGYLKEFYCGDGAGIKTPEWPDGKPYEATFAEGLEEHVAEAMERTRHMRDRGINEWKITKTDPGRVILLDEAGQLFRPNVDPKVKKRMISPATPSPTKCANAATSSSPAPNSPT